MIFRNTLKLYWKLYIYVYGDRNKWVSEWVREWVSKWVSEWVSEGVREWGSEGVRERV